MRIITDSAADFTREELEQNDIRCVPMQVMFGAESFSASALSGEDFWKRLLSGEIGKTSQPSPDAFHAEFEAAIRDGEEVVCIVVSSALSGTMQSAMIAASMLDTEKIHIVDSLCAAGGQKILALHACRLRDQGCLTAGEVAAELTALRSRIYIYAGLDTLDNLARSGRISKAAANIGALAQLKPLVRLAPDTEGGIDVCGKAIGRHRAIDAVVRMIGRHRIDERFPVIALYTHTSDNCAALFRKLNACGIAAGGHMLSALGPTLATHIGAGAYGAAFVAVEE
ncbi:MAG: DegV family protein [Candidatus Ventricola sp.]